MAYGYHGRILCVDLNDGRLDVDEPDEAFYRTYMGGSGLGLWYVLNRVRPSTDPLDPGNVLTFGLSVLTDEQLDVARAFGARSSRNVDKFEGIGYHSAETGSPLLDACATTFDCRVHTVYDLDTYKLIVGDIMAVERIVDEYEPLIYREEVY